MHRRLVIPFLALLLLPACIFVAPGNGGGFDREHEHDSVELTLQTQPTPDAWIPDLSPASSESARPTQ